VHSDKMDPLSYWKCTQFMHRREPKEGDSSTIPVYAFSKGTKFQIHFPLTAFQLLWHVKREHKHF